MFPPKRCHVFLQEIQDRIRIIELYAKDRQFADFVRQHQAWVPLFVSTFTPPGDEDAGQTSRDDRRKESVLEIKESGKIGPRKKTKTKQVYLFSWRRWEMPRQCGNRFITVKSSTSQAQRWYSVTSTTVRHRHPLACQLSGSVSALCVPPRACVPDSLWIYSVGGRGAFVPVNKVSCLLKGIKSFLLFFCFRRSVLDTCRENSST